MRCRRLVRGVLVTFVTIDYVVGDDYEVCGGEFGTCTKRKHVFSDIANLIGIMSTYPNCPKAPSLHGPCDQRLLSEYGWNASSRDHGPSFRNRHYWCYLCRPLVSAAILAIRGRQGQSVVW